MWERRLVARESRLRRGDVRILFSVGGLLCRSPPHTPDHRVLRGTLDVREHNTSNSRLTQAERVLHTRVMRYHSSCGELARSCMSYAGWRFVRTAPPGVEERFDW